jgi:hypothetical protein
LRLSAPVNSVYCQSRFCFSLIAFRVVCMMVDLPPRSSGVRGSITSREYGTVFQGRKKGKKAS